MNLLYWIEFCIYLGCFILLTILTHILYLNFGDAGGIIGLIFVFLWSLEPYLKNKYIKKSNEELR